MKHTNNKKAELVKRYLNGDSITSLCAETGIARSTLYSWVKLYSKLPAATNCDVTYRDYYDLKRHADKLEKMVSILKTVNCTVASPLGQKLEAMEPLYGQYDVHTLCEALEVPRGTYYNHIFRNKKDNTTYAVRRAELQEAIRRIFDDNNQLFGVKKVVAVLQTYGFVTSENMVSELMREMGLYSITPTAKRNYLKWKKGENRNIVQQQFHVTKPNTVWVSDITQYRFQEKYYYICAIIDLFSRKIIAYRISKSSSTQLVTLTYKQAYSVRCPPSGLVFHSDRGKQYLSKSFQSLLYAGGVTQSLSRPGNPHDNAVMESFFANLKKEELYRHDYKSERSLLRGIDQYMAFYNGNRPHATLQYKTPDKAEENYLNTLE